MAAKERLGVLFVHGIGEQARGETLLAFGDPLIVWLQRALQLPDHTLSVEAVAVTENAPRDVLLSCRKLDGDPGPESTCAAKILLRESWWASKFRPPAIFELAWWLLLIGTWATISHAAKPLFRSVGKWNFIVALFRALFFYLPTALTYQLLVFVMGLLGSLPLGPWRDFFAGLMLKLSRTLGDSYVLIHSPIQQRMAVDTVTEDLKALFGKCERVLVVAHSQGAAIAYRALLNLGLPPWTGRDDVVFVSVGSDLDKLDELERLSHTLELRGEGNTVAYRRILYLSPVAFLLFWGILVAGWLLSWAPLQTGLAALGVAGFLTLLSLILIRGKDKKFPQPPCHWVDLYASSDPVSNGKTRGPDEDTEIVNERSLLTDHTSYFSNTVGFLPRIVSRMKALSGISWLPELPPETLERAESRREWRKQLLINGKWANRLGVVVFSLLAHGGVGELGKDAGTTISVCGKALFEWKIPATCGAETFWFYGVLLYALIDMFLRWCNRTADRTHTNLLFTEDRMFRGVLGLLTWLLMLLPLFAWGVMVWRL